MVARLSHWIRHVLGSNKRTLHTWWVGNAYYGELRCDECGYVHKRYKATLGPK